jgi:peptidoglycan LD-endopeptidase CwlK
VVIFGVVSYFLLVLLALGLWLIPEARESALKAYLRLKRLVLGAGQQARGVTRPLRSAASSGGFSALQINGAWFRANAARLLVALAVVLAVPLGMLALRHSMGLDTFDHTVSREVNPQVAALLQGEQLVAPPPLPPELFTTREVVKVRAEAATANRQWELLDAQFRQRLLLVFKLMKDLHGFEMVLIEGYRSPARQAELAALGPQVTQGKAGTSTAWLPTARF